MALPPPLPELGDDLDWLVRDYDGFRIFMLEELAARFPQRMRWTPADLEVVIVEVLAAVLDQLSDAADRAAAEAFLETARRPESVRRLLEFIAYNPVARAAQDIARAKAAGELTPPPGESLARQLERYWRLYPDAMEQARRDGPGAIRTQRRMVSLDDYANRLEDHPLVSRAQAWDRWSGSWNTVHVAVIGWLGTALDDDHAGEPGFEYPPKLRAEVDTFHAERGLDPPEWPATPTIRQILLPYLDAYRMAGQEAILQDAVPVGISMSLSVGVSERYFRSEVRRAVEQALGTGPGGFFEPGRLGFGEDLYASDILQAAMGLEGIENACLNRFKKIGNRYADQAATGRIRLDALEVAVCDNDPARPERGYFHLTLHGGLPG